MSRNHRPLGVRLVPRWSKGSRRYDITLASAAIHALERGERPTDRELRGGLRELRAVRRRIAEHPDNAFAFEWLDDHIDVLRWALTQPSAAQLPMCETCESRPRYFGVYCKRCAPDRPHGRIGVEL